MKYRYLWLCAMPLWAGCSWLPPMDYFTADTEQAAASTPAATGASIRSVWTLDVDQRLLGSSDAYSIPAVNDQYVVIGTQDAYVRIVDLAKGREKHSISIEHACDSGAVFLPNGLVVLGDVGGVLYAIDPSVGTIVWRYALSSSLVSTPAVVGDDVVVQTADNMMYRISAAGEKQWSYTGQASGLNMYLTASPMMAEDMLYAVFANGEAVALDAATGSMLWRRQLILDPDAAVLSELRAPMATPVWLPKFVVSMQEGERGLLVGFYQGDLLVLSAKDGSQLTSMAVSIKASPILAYPYLYLADTEGFLQLLDLRDGRVQWKRKISEHEFSGLQVSGSYVWLTDEMGTVYRTDLQGEHAVHQTLAGRIDRSPVALPAGVLVRTNQGLLTRLQ